MLHPVVVLAFASLMAGGVEGGAPARCARLIGLFDEIVVNRFDHRILRIEDHELAEARRWRNQAAADCAQGEVWFGVHAIEAALERIGVVLPLETEP